MSTLYKAIDVWRRRQDGAIRYRCFQMLSSGRFCVQSADFYTLRSGSERSEFLDRLFIELLLQQTPDERAETFPTLEEAIAQHDHYFADC
jgi:hypothetical protein